MEAPPLSTYSPPSLKILTLIHLLNTKNTELSQILPEFREFSNQFFECHFCFKYRVPGQFCSVIKFGQDLDCLKCSLCISKADMGNLSLGDIILAQKQVKNCWHRVLILLKESPKINY